MSTRGAKTAPEVGRPRAASSSTLATAISVVDVVKPKVAQVKLFVACIVLLVVLLQVLTSTEVEATQDKKDKPASLVHDIEASLQASDMVRIREDDVAGGSGVNATSEANYQSGDLSLTQRNDEEDNSRSSSASSGGTLDEAPLELSAFDAARMGYLRHSIPTSVILTIAYSLVFIVGIIGNSFVVTIVCKSPRMRTVTNYFIANLAFADILVLLLCLPATLMGNLFIPYVLGQLVCKTVSYLQGVAVGASINTMVTVTLDRFLAICYPLSWHMSRRTARRVIACIWLFSLFISLPWALFFTLVPVKLDQTTPTIQVCAEAWPSEQMGRMYFICANLILLYLFPAVVIILCYLGIWYKIERRHIPGDRPRGLKIELIMHKSKLKVVKMMMVVVVIFLLSWLPLYLIWARIKLGNIEERSGWEDALISKVMPLAQWLGASNSCINPILYTFFNRKYKRGFIELLRFVFCCKPLNLASANLSSSRNYNHTTASAFANQLQHMTTIAGASLNRGPLNSAATSPSLQPDQTSWQPAVVAAAATCAPTHDDDDDDDAAANHSTASGDSWALAAAAAAHSCDRSATITFQVQAARQSRRPTDSNDDGEEINKRDDSSSLERCAPNKQLQISDDKDVRTNCECKSVANFVVVSANDDDEFKATRNETARHHEATSGSRRSNSCANNNTTATTTTTVPQHISPRSSFKATTTRTESLSLSSNNQKQVRQQHKSSTGSKLCTCARHLSEVRRRAHTISNNNDADGTSGARLAEVRRSSNRSAVAQLKSRASLRCVDAGGANANDECTRNNNKAQTLVTSSMSAKRRRNECNETANERQTRRTRQRATTTRQQHAQHECKPAKHGPNNIRNGLYGSEHLHEKESSFIGLQLDDDDDEWQFGASSRSLSSNANQHQTATANAANKRVRQAGALWRVPSSSDANNSLSTTRCHALPTSGEEDDENDENDEQLISEPANLNKCKHRQQRHKRHGGDVTVDSAAAAALKRNNDTHLTLTRHKKERESLRQASGERCACGRDYNSTRLSSSKRRRRQQRQQTMNGLQMSTISLAGTNVEPVGAEQLNAV